MSRKLIHACLWGVLLLSVSYAIPVPKGIDGTIFELDGITPVPNGIYFEITNLNTKEVISGKTGPWGSGVYAASIKGNDFDQILVKAWSDYNSANATFVLQGVLHSANLQLNMSLPALPPDITSTPSLTAFKNQPYLYQITAIDINNDDLVFSLVEFPKGMSITQGGLLQWRPTGEDIGHHFIRLAVSDGIFSAEQQYLLFVEDINAPPIITSLPITRAVIRQRYIYDVDAMDADGNNLTYGLLLAPDRMQINTQTGLIWWVPLRTQRGIANVSVSVSDGNASAIQSYSIQVMLAREKLEGEEAEEEETSFELEGSQSGIYADSGGKRVSADQIVDTKKETEGIPGQVNASKDIIIGDPSIDIREISQRPAETTPLERPVYTYLSVQNSGGQNNTLELSFRVENDWLSKMDIMRKDIRISRFIGTWEELPSQLLTGDEKYSYYAAQSAPSDYFAIHGKYPKEIAYEPKISSIDAPYQLSGSVYFFGKRKQIPKGSVISFTNQKTNQTVVLRSGAGPLDGSFSLFLKGNYSDPFLVSIPQFEQAFKATLKDNNALQLTLSLPNSGLQGISGFSIENGAEPSLIGAIIALLFVFLIVHAQTLIYKKKKKK